MSLKFVVSGTIAVLRIRMSGSSEKSHARALPRASYQTNQPIGDYSCTPSGCRLESTRRLPPSRPRRQHRQGEVSAFRRRYEHSRPSDFLGSDLLCRAYAPTQTRSEQGRLPPYALRLRERASRHTSRKNARSLARFRIGASHFSCSCSYRLSIFSSLHLDRQNCDRWCQNLRSQPLRQSAYRRRFRRQYDIHITARRDDMRIVSVRNGNNLLDRITKSADTPADDVRTPGDDNTHQPLDRVRRKKTAPHRSRTL